MATLKLQIPNSLNEEGQDEIVQFIASKLYEDGRLSLGQAAEMCSMKKWDFPAVLVKYNVSYFRYTVEDVIAEFERVKDWR
jgi:predicted HTH domain antitoxin